MGPPSFLQVDQAVPSGPVGPRRGWGGGNLSWPVLLLPAVPYALGMRRALKIKRAFEQYLKQGTFRTDAILFVANDFRLDWETVCSIVKG